MADQNEQIALDLPTVFLARMLVFAGAVAILAAILFPQILSAFNSNVGLNGLIAGVALLGMLYCFRMVLRLWREVNWVNSFRVADPLAEARKPPVLLAPMAMLLGDRQGRTVLSPLTMRTLLDSLAARLDEARDISRYLVGLLIFLGLLGTFWGLLATVTSIGDAIRVLDVGSAQSGTVFEELKSGLERPLAGMGLSFSSSLFGLAGSLVLGFLDLQASQAQNRFYNDFENWLSSFTDIEAGETNAAMAPAMARLDLRSLEKAVQDVNRSIADASATARKTNGRTDSESLDQLADAVASLVKQMREEQKMVRHWVETQQLQQNDIQRLLTRLSSGPAAAPGGGRPQKRYSFETGE